MEQNGLHFTVRISGGHCSTHTLHNALRAGDTSTLVKGIREFDGLVSCLPMHNLSNHLPGKFLPSQKHHQGHKFATFVGGANEVHCIPIKYNSRFRNLVNLVVTIWLLIHTQAEGKAHVMDCLTLRQEVTTGCIDQHYTYSTYCLQVYLRYSSI